MSSDSRDQLPEAIVAAAAILNRGAESVRAVLAREENRFSAALDDLRRLSKSESIPLAIVGDFGAIHFGYSVATQDIDIAVASSQLDALVKAAPNYGFKIAWQATSGWHTLTHGDVEINVVPEGAKARTASPTTIPGPAQLGVVQGLNYASLPGWIELKISSGRQKDRAHIIEIMKKNSVENLRAAREHLVQVHPSYAELFDQLLEEAQAEQSQENQRGKE